MPPKKTAPSITTPPPSPKKAAAAVRSFIDDAPLFAGLDDYILKQTATMEMKSTKTGTVAEKKKLVPKQQRKTKPHTPPPERIEKPHKTVSHDDQAIVLSVAEMCKLLKISRATLVRMDKAGQIPGRMKIGGSVRFHRPTIDSWLQSLIVTHVTQT